MAPERWDIAAYEGAGPLRFGMKRSKVRSLLNKRFSTFMKGDDAASLTDACETLQLHLYYDTSDRLICIEAFGTCPIYYQHVPLLKGSKNQVLDQLAATGLSMRFDDGYFFDEAGFTLYAPGESVEAVTVYQKGYYDE